LPINYIESARNLSEEVIQALVEVYRAGGLDEALLPMDIERLEILARDLPALHMAMAEILDAYQRNMPSPPPADDA
ncbi:MAG: hypothetical protein ACLFTK_15220, partial [Anaerolineales bacterium]